MLIGYARVSTQDQKPGVATRSLNQGRVPESLEDKVSGTRADRPGLAKALELLREGDTLVV